MHLRVRGKNVLRARSRAQRSYPLQRLLAHVQPEPTRVGVASTGTRAPAEALMISPAAAPGAAGRRQSLFEPMARAANAIVPPLGAHAGCVA